MRKTWADVTTVLHQRTVNDPEKWWLVSSFPFPSHLVEREFEAAVKRGEAEKRLRPGSEEEYGYRAVLS